MLGDGEHVRIAQAAEAPDEIPFGDRIAAGGQHVGMSMVDDWLAATSTPSQSKMTNSKRVAVI